ncbi:MAG: hypothetical protein MZW92_24150 [Comamonadaceae bacterium]|nr:hypothetical protein [Comamonadaceae bacterium]
MSPTQFVEPLRADAANRRSLLLLCALYGVAAIGILALCDVDLGRRDDAAAGADGAGRGAAGGHRRADVRARHHARRAAGAVPRRDAVGAVLACAGAGALGRPERSPGAVLEHAGGLALQGRVRRLRAGLVRAGHRLRHRRDAAVRGARRRQRRVGAGAAGRAAVLDRLLHLAAVLVQRQLRRRAARGAAGGLKAAQAALPGPRPGEKADPHAGAADACQAPSRAPRNSRGHQVSRDPTPPFRRRGRNAGRAQRLGPAPGSAPRERAG